MSLFRSNNWAVCLGVLGAIATLTPATGAEKGEKGSTDDGWIVLWDGKTFKNWKASENKDSWIIENGAIVAHGPRSHLFYVGPEAPFKNFIFEAEVMTTPGSNSGIYFHTKYQDSGWPSYGFEAQVNNSHKDPKRTGSLYGVVNVSEPPARDNEWFKMRITVKGKRIIIEVNDKKVVDYTEPPNAKPASGQFKRVIGEGTFALQAHDPNSKVYFRNLRVKKLP